MGKVSIIMPLHNKEPYLREAVDSLINQSHTDWEALIIENNSSDNGSIVAKEMEYDDSRIRLYDVSGKISGPGAARNHGLSIATGEWVLFFDCDDALHPDHLESLLVAAEENHADVAVSNWLEISDKDFSQGISAGTRKTALASGEGDSTTLLDTTIAFAPWAVHCALVRRESLSGKPCWIEELDSFPSEDTAFWFQNLHDQRVVYTGKFTALYRVEATGCRNEYQHLEKWSAAMAGIERSNLEFLNNSGLEPSPGQRESLMRMWEDIGRRASDGRNSNLAGDAFRRARQHLMKIRTFESAKPCSILLRKVVGLRLLHQLRKTLARSG